MKLSIIIVHYNVAQLLENALVSIQKYIEEIDYEVLVIDNHSPDDSWKKLIEKFPKVQFFLLNFNNGFAFANNFGVEKAKGDYILLLNPDTELEGFYMKEILEFADSKVKMGCLSVRMHDKNGRFLPESKRSVPNITNSFEKLFVNFSKNEEKSYYRKDIGEYEIAEVEVITGAFLLVKRANYLKIGGLDKRYFMYGEDIDFCYTLLNKGYQNYYYGKSSILHYKGESTIKDKVYLGHFYGAMHIFANKYYRKKPVIYFMIKIGLTIKHFLEKRKLKP